MLNGRTVAEYISFNVLSNQLRKAATIYRLNLLGAENSQMANARFQAATAIRDAAIREWSFLSPDEKKSLIRFVTTLKYYQYSI